MNDHVSVKREVSVAGGPRVFVDLEGHDPVRRRSNALVNEKVTRKIEESVRDAARLSRDDLSARIERLDHEWDVDRAVMMFFSAVAALALRASKRDRRWLNLIRVQLPFLALHAWAGWCPPTALLRRLGFRTRREIDAEKYALKTMRGDYSHAA